MDRAVIEDHAVVTIAGTAVRGGHRITGSWRVRNQKKADLLVITGRKAVGAKLRKDAVDLRVREQVDLHGCRVELGSKFLPARTVI